MLPEDQHDSALQHRLGNVMFHQHENVDDPRPGLLLDCSLSFMSVYMSALYWLIVSIERLLLRIFKRKNELFVSPSSRGTVENSICCLPVC